MENAKQRKMTILLKEDQEHPGELLERFKRMADYNGFEVEGTKKYTIGSFQTNSVPPHYKGGDHVVVGIGVYDRYRYSDLRRPTAERYNIISFESLTEACERWNA